jgi:hypothetical protein
MSNDFEERLPEDEKFEAYLQRDGEVSQRYRELGGRAVPPALDAKVLRQAREHSERMHERGLRRWLRWGAPLAVAATALIAVSVVLQPGVREAAAPRASRAPAAAPAVAVESQPGVAQTRSEKRADALADSSTLVAPPMLESPPAATVRQPPANSPRDGSNLVSQGTQGRGVPIADELELRSREARNEPHDALRTVPGRSSSARVLSSTTPSRERIYVQEGLTPPSAAAPAAPSVPAAEAAKQKAESDARSSVTSRRTDRSSPKSPSASEPATAAEPVTVGRAEERKAVEPAKPNAEARHHYEAGETRNYATYVPPPPAPTSVAPVATEQASGAQAGLQSRAAVEVAPADVESDRTIPPDVWVKWIRELRAERKTDIAATFLKRLRTAHPDFVLPPDVAPAAAR